ncbi:MAG TPA: hypothetical protein VEH49_00050 [Methylomirabilota bacterium]|nr:hypothetical protein [Methylomirabilota bacterium]
MRIRAAACLFFAAAVAVAAASAAPQTVDDVVAKILDARGGAAKLRAIQTERVIGRISFGADAEGPFLVEFKRPAKYHMHLEMLGRRVYRTFDGKAAGWTLNPFAGDTEPRAMTADEVKDIAEEADFDGPFLDYRAKGIQIELVGKDKVEDKEALRLKVTSKSGDVRFYLADAAGFQLLKWEGKRKGQNGQDFDIESFFHDYRDVNGFKFAFEVLSGAPGQPPVQKIVVEKFEIDPAIDDADFGKPPAPAPPPPAPKP